MNNELENILDKYRRIVYDGAGLSHYESEITQKEIITELTKLISKREIEARISTLQSLMLKYVDIMQENRKLSSKEIDEKVMDYVAERIAQLTELQEGNNNE